MDLTWIIRSFNKSEDTDLEFLIKYQNLTNKEFENLRDRERDTIDSSYLTASTV